MFVYVCNCWLEHCVNRWRCERLIRQFQHLNTLNIELIWGYVQIFIHFFFIPLSYIDKRVCAALSWSYYGIYVFKFVNDDSIWKEKYSINLFIFCVMPVSPGNWIPVNERNAFILLMEGIIPTFTWFVTTRDYSDNISNGYDWQIMIMLLMGWGFILNIEL